MTSPRREARRARAHAEFAGYPAPPTPGWWPCPRDSGVFRRYDGVGWTDWTRPAKQPSDHRPSPDGASSGPPPGRARGSAIQRGRWEMGQFLHDVTDDELRGLPKATLYDIEPDRPERGWWPDPAAPDLGQRRFYTGTDWLDLVAFVGRTGSPRYYRSTLEESRRRNEFRLQELSHEPSLTLAPAAAVWAVLLTAVASSLLIVAPALPPGTGSDLAHSIGVVASLGILTALCAAAVQIARSVPLEWRSFPLWVPYGLAVVAFVVARGFRSVLAALGLG